uniref:Nanos homolog 2 n=1 Tax=Caligus rogercresseyi TaxID=217165 RepID=C1BR24_CALRO|nr:Nanos homolog 2 [Caligus rogercresseyi]
MTTEMDLVTKIFSEPEWDDLEKDLRALDPTLEESLKIFDSLNKRSSGSWSDFSTSSSGSESERLFNRRGSLGGSIPRPYPSLIQGSGLCTKAPEFVPSTYAAAVSKLPGPPSGNFRPRFVVPILKRPPPPQSNKPIPELTANNAPRPPIRMTPSSLKKLSPPEIVLPVFQASFQISAKPPTSSYNAQSFSRNNKTCEYCRSKGESRAAYSSHCLRNPLTGKVICPLLREYMCEVCKSTGDDAHVESKCPLNLIGKDNPTLVRLTLDKNSGKARS